MSNKEAIADRFNEFVTNIGPNLAAKINSTNKPAYSFYLTNKTEHTFSFEEVDSSDIKTIIQNFKPKSSTGHDSLSMKHIKGLISSISEPLTLITNQSLKTVIFRSKMKIEKVIPLHKKDDNTILDNYRPISLLPVMSKILEKVVYNQIYGYFKARSLFYKSQHGFKKLHSTETAALVFIARIINILDNGELPISIYLDLSKAFHTLDHNILCHKLEYYGISGTHLIWFQDYLTNRSQFV